MIIVAATAITLLALLFAAAIWFFHAYFHVRYETPVGAAFDVSEFDSLVCERHTFPSDKGQELVGYLYQNEDIPKKGLLIFAHGYAGGGHKRYMALLNTFAQRGYVVFGYDSTGNDESEGDGVYGLPQGIIDLNHAIDYASLLSEVSHLPLYLAGHSWGAYSATHALADHPEVRGVVSFAGFESTTDLIASWGENVAGAAANLVVPFMSLYERMRFGRFHSLSATEAFRNCDTRIVIVHSADDQTVPLWTGYEIWEAEFKEDERFMFIRYEDRGHSGVFLSDEYRAWEDQYEEGIRAWRTALPYDYRSEANAERYEEDFLAFQGEHFDREWYRNYTDVEQIDRIISFWEG